MTEELLWPILITAVAVFLHWRLHKCLPRLGNARHGPTADRQDAYLALFAVAHHDIWWAKEHAWTIVTYVVGAIVTLVVVDFTSIVDTERLLVTVLYTGSAALATWYAGRMQSDMAIARIRSAYLVRRSSGLDAVLAELIGDDRDYYRGSFFMLGLALLTSGVSAIAVAVLQKSQRAGWIAYAVLAAWAVGMLYSQVAYRAFKVKARLFLEPESTAQPPPDAT